MTEIAVGITRTGMTTAGRNEMTSKTRITKVVIAMAITKRTTQKLLTSSRTTVIYSSLKIFNLPPNFCLNDKVVSSFIVFIFYILLHDQ